MPKRNELSSENRVEVQLLLEQGKSQVEISKTVKCSRRSLQFVIQRFYAIRSHQNIPKTGRKRITTDRQDHQLPRESLKNRKKLSSELAAELSEQNKESISARTTCRRLYEADPKGCDARKKPWLPTKTKKKLGINGPYNIELSPIQSGQILCGQTNLT
ncbi:hypothetical protein SFRURICE_018274 [Spodoptera frugiperda]|nr:hypothetical protein SFRURICE_018274 [Spodoptera frugiperda]